MADQPLRVLSAHDKYIMRPTIEPVEGATEFEERHIANVREKGSDACREGNSNEVLLRPPAVRFERHGLRFVNSDMPSGIRFNLDSHGVTFFHSFGSPPRPGVRLIV